MQKKYYLLILLSLAAILEFWHLGSQPVKEYDEARYAANAFEMMHNHDYINLHYGGEPDTWVARPPVKAWLIIAGYKLLGFNEWGLRLSSGLAVMLFLLYAYRLINLYLPDPQAFLACLLLISVKGIIGFHVGRNADMDAELIALLTLSAYYFLRYLDFQDRQAILWAGLFAGISFWVKTTACFYYVPGFILYLVVSKRFLITLRDSCFWKSISIFIGLVLLWFVILGLYGSTYTSTNSFHQYDSSWKTMLIYDTWDRFTSSNFDKHPVETDPLFFVHSIDSIFNIWNYFFYAGILFYIFNRYNKKQSANFLQTNFYKICTISICILLPIVLLLTFGMHKLPWYTSPSLLFLTILALYAIHEIALKLPYTYWIVSALLMFAIGRNFLWLEQEISEKNEIYFLREHQPLWQNNSTVYYIGNLPQNVYVYLLWQDKKVLPLQATTADSNSIVIGEQKLFPRYSGRLDQLAASNQEKHVKALFFAKIKP
ncbi:MAG TPA: glycosyltransferase family 39 protein [Cytophagaceae bacterium]|jgi:4-amino-4-deoxy-L-arabinose transferase-like glycosyltransferase|nr:glycosyltransferase family 39 protein [Cytophagaceae bacterium]